MFYYNSIIKRELAEEAKKIAGKVFYASPPDIYTGVVFAYLQKKYLHINMPMSIGGSSEKSLGIGGADSIYKPNLNNTASSFELRNLKEMNMDYHDFFVPYFSGEEGALVIASKLAKKIFFNNKADIDLNMRNFFRSCIKSLFEDECFEFKKEELYDCIKNYRDKSIVSWYEENYYYNKSFTGFKNYQLSPLKPLYNDKGGLIVNSSNFGVTNVFEAAQLYRNIVGY
jgi:hypothetical protein